jgi:hypothetical protein
MSDVQVIAQQRTLTDVSADFSPWPERPELLVLMMEEDPLRHSPRPKAKAKGKGGKHSGTLAIRDALLCRSVCIDLLTGELSEREIADRHRIGRETLHGIRDLMRSRGDMRPLEQAIRGGLSSCIVLMLLRLKEALLAGEYSPSQIPISLCALIDKKGQLDAGIVPGTERTEAEAWESQVDVAARALQRARALVVSQAEVGRPGTGPSECASGGQGPQVVDVQASVVASDPPATAPATRAVPASPPDQAPVQTSGAVPGGQPAEASSAPAAPSEGGGGVTRAPAPPLPDWDTSQNFGPKEPS